MSKVASSSIEQVFADPAGNHVLLLMKVNNTYETHYMHRCAAAWQNASKHAGRDQH